MIKPAGPGVLIAGLVLVAAYAVTSMVFGGFMLPTGADYMQLRDTLAEVGVDQVIMRDVAPHVGVAAVARLLLLGPAALLLAWWLASRWPARSLEPGARLLAGSRHRVALTAITLATAGLLLFWSQGVLREQPLYDDEFTYLFQAQTLASGWIAAPAPPNPGAFDNPFIIIDDDHWFGKYSSGHPALLALSSLLGWPRLIPLLLAALVPWLVYQIGREIDGPRVGLLAAALLTVSPYFLIPASTLMNHGTTLFFVAVFTLGFLRAQRTAGGRRWLWALGAGLALGVAFNIRPQSAAAVGLPFGVWTLWRLRGETAVAVRVTAIGVVAGLLLPLAWAGYYNHVVAGAWYRFPFMLLESGADGAGSLLATKDWTEPGHTFFKGVFFGLLNLWRLNGWLFGWGASLVLVGIGLARGVSAFDRVWLGVAALILGLHAFFQSPAVLELGPRYLFPLVIPLMLWSARGLVIAHEWVTARQGPRALVTVFVLVSVVLALGTFTREHAQHLRMISAAVARPYEFVEAREVHDAIVMVRAKPSTGWVFGLRNPHPRLETNDVIYIKLTGLDDVVGLLDAMPDRKVFVLAFDPDDPAADPELVRFSRAQLEQIREERRRDPGQR